METIQNNNNNEIENINSNNNENNNNENNNNENKDKKINPIIKLIVNHYKQNPQIKSEEQIENEKYLFLGLSNLIKFNRWILFPCAILSQFTVGSLYAWSIYNKPVDEIIFGDKDKGYAPITFYIVFFFFGLACSTLGPVLDKLGPKNSMYIGSTLFVIGHFITSLGIHVKTIWLVYIGYGAIGGVGMGICYISPVSTLQKWFPDHRGLSSGLAVCGFGAGSIAFSSIPIKIIAKVGLSLNFLILGCIYLVILYSTSFIFRTPPPNFQINGKDSDLNKVEQEQQQQQQQQHEQNKDEENVTSSNNIQEEQKVLIEPKFSDYKLSDAIISNEYRIIYVMFLCNIIFGVVAIGRLSDMVQNMFGKSKEVGSVIVSVNGAFNLLGRLIFAVISDKFGRKRCYIAMLTIQCFSVGFLIYSMKYLKYDSFIALIWISTFCYGGSFGVIPAFLNDMFGSKNVGALHGIILTAWAIAGVCGGIAFSFIYKDLIDNYGYSHSSAYPYLINYYWIVAFICLGWCLVWFIRTSVPDVFLPPIKGQIIRIKLFNRYLRISTSKGIELISNYKFTQEWNDYLIQYNKDKNNNNNNN